MNEYQKEMEAGVLYLRNRGSQEEDAAFQWRLDHPGEHPGDLTQIIGSFELRDLLVRKYAWAIPNQEALEAIAACGPIIEIGAGRGYWASLLHDMGVDIIAYDPAPMKLYSSPDEEYTAAPHFPVKVGDGSVAAKYPERALLLVWPCYADGWAHEALKGYHAAGGRTVCFVGEGRGGCTADDAFFDYLWKHQQEADQEEPNYVYLPTWSGIRDQLEIVKLKGQYEDST